MSEQEERAAIVAEALSWEATPYLKEARIKGVGVDCAQLPLAVFHATGHIPEMFPTYSSEWMYHRDEELYVSEILKWSREIEREQLGAGDLVVWKFGRTYSHSAIVINPPEVIHAVARGSAVVRADMERDVDLSERLCRYFSVFGRS